MMNQKRSAGSSGRTIVAVLLAAWSTMFSLSTFSADGNWMEGFPPPAEQRINRQDFSMAPGPH